MMLHHFPASRRKVGTRSCGVRLACHVLILHACARLQDVGFIPYIEKIRRQKPMYFADPDWEKFSSQPARCSLLIEIHRAACVQGYNAQNAAIRHEDALAVAVLMETECSHNL